MKHTESQIKAQIKTMNLFQGKELSSKELKEIEGGFYFKDKIFPEIEKIRKEIIKLSGEGKN